MKKERKITHADLLHGPLAGKIILFALPLALSSILQQLFNMADTAVVGRFASSQAMAAVGANAALINLIVALFVGISVGVNVRISAYIGLGVEERINRAVHTSILVALIAGSMLLVLGIFLSKPLLLLVNTPDDVIDLAILYLRIYFIGMPASLIYNFGSAILRSKGDSRRPLYALALAGVINVILNLIFVIGLKMSVAGVGLATVISNTISAAIVIWFLRNEEEIYRLDLRKLTIDKNDLKFMLKIGLPAGGQGMLFSLSNTVILSAINSFGYAAAAGSTACVNYEAYSYLLVNAFSQAGLTFTSQNFAARQFDRCKKIYRLTFAFALIGSALLDAAFVAGRSFFLGVFTTDQAVIGFALMRMFRVLVFQWLVSTYEVAGSTLRAMNYSLTPTLLMVFGTCILRIIWVSLIFPMNRTFPFLLTIYPISWVITGSLVIGTYFYLRKKVFAKPPANTVE